MKGAVFKLRERLERRAQVDNSASLAVDGLESSTLAPGCGWLQPERSVAWLHRLTEDGEQAGREGTDIDFVAQPGAERLDRLLRVVSPSIEASVYRLLNAATGRTE